MSVPLIFVCLGDEKRLDGRNDYGKIHPTWLSQTQLDYNHANHFFLHSYWYYWGYNLLIRLRWGCVLSMNTYQLRMYIQLIVATGYKLTLMFTSISFHGQ